MEAGSLPSWLRAAVADYAARLRAGLGENLRGIRLFGSWARGQARPDSDIDVWVLVGSRDETARTGWYRELYRV